MTDASLRADWDGMGSRVTSLDCSIRPGVVLFLGGVDDCADRVQLSSGTIAAAAASPDVLYEDGAMIPRPGWRSPTMADRKALIAESCPTLYGNAISVVRLPSQLLDLFRPLRIAASQYRSTEKLSPIIGSGDCSKGTDAIITYLQEHYRRSATDEDCGLPGGIAAYLPGLQTVTMNPATEAFVGLHVDSWYRRDFGLSRREHAPNRVCVNLGSADRFLLFMNIPVSEMCKVMENELSCERDFMRSFPSYPVVRVRIRPGEAYIAPTENIVHDGSSIDMNAMDVTFSLRGRFWHASP